MLRNIRNIRNICKLRGVINSDTPKRVSRFVTPPLQGVSRFATVPWQYSKNHFCFFKQKGKQGQQSQP